MDTEPIREGNKIAYKGIVFELAKPYEPDTVMVEDAVTKELTMMITTRTGPPDIIKMNGEEVFTNIHGADDAFYDLETQALNTIRKEIEPIVKKLPKGIYTFFIYNAIVTKEGKLVFYDIGGIEQSYKKTEDEPIIIPADMKKKIVDKMAMAMEKLEVSQYQKDDKPIHYNMRIAGNIKVD